MSSQNSAKPGRHGGCDPNLRKTTYANNIEQIREKRHRAEIPSIAEVFADRPKLLKLSRPIPATHISSHATDCRRKRERRRVGRRVDVPIGTGDNFARRDLDCREILLANRGRY
jgi:hypothetical protein